MLQESRGVRLHGGIAAALAIAAEAFLVGCASGVAHLAYHMAAYSEAGSIERLLEFAVLSGVVYAFVRLVQHANDGAPGPAERVDIGKVLLIWNTVFVLTLFVLFAAKTLEAHSRGAVITSYGFGLVAAVAAQLALAALFGQAARRGLVAPRQVLLIGTPATIGAFVRGQVRHRHAVSVIETIELPPAGDPAQLDHVLELAVERARDREPDDIVLAIGTRDTDIATRVIEVMGNTPAGRLIVHDPLVSRFRDIGPARIGDVQALVLNRQRLTPFNQILKRAFDFTFATLGLLVLMPLLAAIAIAIRLESRGPALFCQTRYGFNEEPFRILKFRTMTACDDGSAVPQAKRGDRRITRLGGFLRRTSLDELPQLVNVVQGDMSLVGPRPHAVAHNHYYEQRIARYARRHNVKPGITGWAQVHGLRGETETDDKMARRVDYDLYYLDNWSFGLDMRILALTVLTVMGGRNAY